MWLLNTSTYQIVFAEDPSQVRYAILSHVWSSTGEQTFQHIQTIHTSARSSFPYTCEDTDPRLLDVIRSQLSTKITSCCDYARSQGHPNLWIDACCIDKTSSAELSEAINSMFTWYSQADVCYVFLSDVSSSENPVEKLSFFRRSIWFKRGWTLQELIVPSRIVFLAKDWRMIGTVAGLAKTIEDVTGIDADILLHRRQLQTVSVAQRMAWAAGRETTRIEDEAYCLMGIFGVRLAVIYGEGSQAFVRLQEEIMTRIPDQSLFLWGIQPDVRCFPPPPATLWPLLTSVSMVHLRASKSAYLFASSPMDFFHSKGFTPVPLGTFSGMLELPDASRPPLHTPSGYGVYTTLPIITLSIPAEEDQEGTEFQAAILVRM
ncbi:Vegetative incompatibility protein HET-E-1 [Trametes pubescens]|uniref:Vegetative incompatibility protein HET-E-1 n=1 Tax=Trametes pubescens TaxID=154538 RepID=A0A1M2V2G0_TRAPU|nr:Vegetative incompatibility protein HET-E-1 [Trametes pubescens]